MIYDLPTWCHVKLTTLASLIPPMPAHWIAVNASTDERCLARGPFVVESPLNGEFLATNLTLGGPDDPNDRCLNWDLGERLTYMHPKDGVTDDDGQLDFDVDDGTPNSGHYVIRPIAAKDAPWLAPDAHSVQEILNTLYPADGHYGSYSPGKDDGP